MLDKFLALLERFVVAHELIAANSAKQALTVTGKGIEAIRAREKVITHGAGGSGKSVLNELDELDKDVKKRQSRKNSGDEDEEAAEIREEIEREEKIKSRTERKPRATKPKAEPEPDLDKLREEIEVMAKHIGSGPSVKCDDEFEDMLEDYDVRSVKKLKDLQVQEFHKELKAIVAKYYDIEE